jgi:hypothetical protein
MPNLLALLLLPPLLIFSLYHLSLWFDLFAIRRMLFWRRVSAVSALSHVLIAMGIFGLLYLDFKSAVSLLSADLAFDAFLLNNGQFWQTLLVFDTLAAVTVVGLLAILDYAGTGPGPILPLTMGLVLILGTFQWYWIGGILGAVFERVWSGLKTQGEDRGL